MEIIESERERFKKLYQLNSRLSELFTHAFSTKTMGITRLQARVLYVLDHSGALTMGELSNVLRAHNSNLTPVVDQLCNEAYVTRVASLNDRRLVEIGITEKGVRLSRQLSVRIDDYIERLSEEERKELRELMLESAELL